MRKQRQHTISRMRQITLVVLIVIGCQYFPIATAYCQTQKHVLVLHSYHEGFTWTDSIQRGISEQFAELEDVELYIEYMDTKRTAPQLLFPFLAKVYARKYRDVDIDLILTTDDNAFNFAISTRALLFSNAPVVFCGVNNYEPSRLQGNTDITGVVESVDFLGGTELILKLFPSTKTIAVISDVTPTGDLHKKQYEQEVIAKLTDQVNFKKLYRLTAGELKTELSGLSGDSVVFDLTFWRDPTGRSFNHRESNSLVANASPVPVFTAWDHTLSYGLLGGVVTSGYRQGKIAAQMAKRILTGEKPAEIRIIEKSPNVPMFDYTVMQRFGLSLSDLPANSVVLNQPESFYHKYRNILWLIVVVILAQMGVILLLLNVVRRRKVQRDLQESEERYRRLAENSPDMIYRMTIPDGRYEYVSRASDSIFGYPPEIWYKKPVLIKDLIHPDSQNYFVEQWEQLTKGHLLNTFEYKILHRNKGTRWLFQRNVAIRDDAGQIVAMEGIVTDITERKRMEKALVHAEAHLRILVNTIPDLVWLKNPEGTYLSCNRAFERFFGVKEAEIIGKTDLQLVDRALAESSLRLDKRAMAAEEPVITEEPLASDKTGNQGLFETVRMAMRYADGNLIGVLGVGRNITKRKSAEDALKKNEQRYKSAQRMGNVGNWEYDIAANTFWASEQAKRIFGFDLSAQHFSVEEVERCISERKRVHQALIDLIENNKAYDIEYEIVPLSGPPRKNLRSVAEVNRNEQGAAKKVVGVVQDITQQKRTEVEKIELERQLRQSQKMEAIGTLAGGIAHDFNNILGAILGYAEMAREECSADSSIVSDLDQVIQGSLRAKDLVKQILTFSRQSKAQRVPVQPAAILKETINLLRSSLPATIHIEQDISSVASRILADPIQIHQIVLNISTNALHAMEETGGTLTISLSGEELTGEDLLSRPRCQPGEYIHLSIADTGPGISPEIIEKIFDPYFTTKDTGKGTGMGLAIVHGIVKSHGGFIDCHNRPDSGTIFHIYLPVLQQEVEIEMVAEDTVPTGNERILYIDDEPMLVEMAEVMLTRLGYDVTIHTSSQEAFRAFKDNPDDFDLVITDQTMPDITGVEMAKKILSIRPQIPIILCTGFSTTVSRETARSFGIKGFALKPLVRKELALLIRKVLDEN